MKASQVKITMFLEKDIWEEVSKGINNLQCIRRDALLNVWLDSELDRLEKMPRNTLSKEAYVFQFGNFYPVDKKKVNITFDASVISRLDEILRAKNVPRNLFFNAFIRSLGDPIGNLETSIWEPFNEVLTTDNQIYTELFPSVEQAAQIEKEIVKFRALLKEGIKDL